MNKPTVADCRGCQDDFYNHNRMGGNESSGQPRCWSLDSAEFVMARDVPIDMRPPYLRLKETSRPSCYKAKGYVRVKAGALDSQGFWKSF